MRSHTFASTAALLVAVTIAPPLVAQSSAVSPGATQSGIYVSADAYRAGTLEQAVDTRTGSHVIDRHSLLNKPYVDVDHGGKRVRYQKSAIFGFRDPEGRDVRFVGNREYTILESGPLYIYATERVVPDAKRTKIVKEYWFSTGPSAPVSPLTRENVKRAFPSEHQFHHQLDMTFADDASLTAYDDAAKTFKIVALYRQSR